MKKYEMIDVSMSALTHSSSLKPSFVNWLDDIPTHWAIRRLGDSVSLCQNGTWGSEPNENNTVRCVRVADFDRNSLRVKFRISTFRSISRSELKRHLLQKGDLLLEKSGGGEHQPVGAVVLFEHSIPAICSNFIARMPVNEDYYPLYLTYLHFTLYSLRLNTKSIKQTTGIQNLDSQMYLNELVAFPPYEEQVIIAEFLDSADQMLRGGGLPEIGIG